MLQQTYREIAVKAMPLDIIFFKGDDIISEIVEKSEKYETNNDFTSHVGIIVTSEILPKITTKDGKVIRLNPGLLYIFESTVALNGPKDLETGKNIHGVQLRVLEDVIKNYITDDKIKVSWGKLKNNPLDLEKVPLNRKPFDEITQTFQELFDKYEGTSYQFNPVDLLAAAFPDFRWLRNTKEYITKFFSKSNDWLFCSELVVKIFQSLNIMDKNVDSGNILPVDLLKMVEEPILFKI